MAIDKTEETGIEDKVKAYTDILDGNPSDPKYIYKEYDFEGFIMDDYLPHQRYEWPTNEW